MFFSLSRVQKEVTEGPETSVLKSPIISKCSYLSQQFHFNEIASLSDGIFSILNNFAVVLFLKYTTSHHHERFYQGGKAYIINFCF